jgi:hypothetical protein
MKLPVKIKALVVPTVDILAAMAQSDKLTEEVRATIADLYSKWLKEYPELARGHQMEEGP